MTMNDNDLSSNLSLAALTILDAGPIGQVRAAAEAGFTSVGLRLQPLLPTDVAVIGDANAMDELAQLIAQTKMRVLEIGVFPLKAGMDLEALGPVLSFSHKLGARYIVCPAEDDDKKRRAETFAELCDLAETCALEALVEFNPYSACRSLNEAYELVTKADRPNGKLLIDAFHLSRSGAHPLDLRSVPKDLLALVHLCDAEPLPTTPRSVEDLRRESRTARLLPGDGSLWLDALLDALPPGIPLSIEAPAAKNAHLPAAERARLALAASQRLLAKHGSTA